MLGVIFSQLPTLCWGSDTLDQGPGILEVAIDSLDSRSYAILLFDDKIANGRIEC